MVPKGSLQTSWQRGLLCEQPGKHRKVLFFLGSWIAGFRGKVDENQQQLVFQEFVLLDFVQFDFPKYLFVKNVFFLILVGHMSP